MRIPADAIIAEEKLTRYLLVPQEYNDKSGFLAKAEFNRENPEVLLGAIRRLVATRDAEEDSESEYGTFYRVEGALIGPAGTPIAVVTVWLRSHVDGTYRFITLKPRRKTR